MELVSWLVSIKAAEFYWHLYSSCANFFYVVAFIRKSINFDLRPTSRGRITGRIRSK